MKKLTAHDKYRKIMKGRKKWRSFEINYKYNESNDWVSCSNTERRLREMKDVYCLPEIRNGKKVWFYYLEDKFNIALVALSVYMVGKLLPVNVYYYIYSGGLAVLGAAIYLVISTLWREVKGLCYALNFMALLTICLNILG